MIFDFNQAVFTYAIASKKIESFGKHLVLKMQDLVVNYTDATEVYHTVFDNNEVVIIGLCVDSYGQIAREDIPYSIAGLQGPENIYSFAERLNGKYIIIYSGVEECYAFGDATCSIPLNYAGNLYGGEICISPFDRMTAEFFHYTPDDRLLNMRKAADPAQTMPGDLTPYKQVKALLPNQYLNILTGQANRISIEIPETSFEEVIERSIKISENAARDFIKYYKIICPLTCGYDSRVALSILQQVYPDIECFTTELSPRSEESDDINIAIKVCQNENINHTLFGYYDPPQEYIESVNNMAGLINSVETIKEAYSYVIDAGNKARINGNIIGQIGKSSVMNCVPDSLATASFLTCKIHNRDKHCVAETEKYITDLKHSNKRICDLFAYENRCGRWGGQEEALYSLCGMNSLNLFNCRELILLWISVKRKKRVNKEIHIAMIQKTNHELLKEPFNPNDKLSFLKNNWFFYYIATFAKQMLLKRKRV